MKKKCKAIDEEIYTKLANKLSEIKIISRTIISLSIEFDFDLLPLAEILNNKVNEALTIMSDWPIEEAFPLKHPEILPPKFPQKHRGQSALQQPE